MKQYLALLQKTLEQGTPKKDRTGVGTIGIFGAFVEFDLRDGFPLVTTKRVHFKSVVEELLWFISGQTNITSLVRNDVNIWNEWPFANYLATKNMTCEPNSEEWKRLLKEFVQKIKEDDEFARTYGELGPVYGAQWRNFNGFDQLAWVINEIKNNPNSRRLLVSAWNPPEIKKMALPPCHFNFQFYTEGQFLDILVGIRSWDVFLGGPFNIASYALLLSMVAQVTGYVPRKLMINSGDTHIYKNQFEAVQTQLSRTPFKLPSLVLNQNVRELWDFERIHITLEGYRSADPIKVDIAV